MSRAPQRKLSRPLIELAVGAACLLQVPATGVVPQAAPPAPAKPLIEIGWGDHPLRIEGWEGLKFWMEGRWRVEQWRHLEKPGQDGSYNYEHTRVRQGLSQTLGPVELGFEWQAVNLFGVDPRVPAGPGKNYRDANSGGSPQSLSIRQLYGALDVGGPKLRVGRQLYEDSGGIKCDDPSFQYVRDRGNARLVGTLDWPASGRTFDGVSIGSDSAKWLLRGIGFEANEGAFDIDDSGDSLADVRIAGVEVVSKVGTLVPNTELRAFGFDFRDDRAPTTAKFGDDLQADLVGVQAASRIKLGPGAVDGWFWAAHESGDAGTRSLRAGAWIAEAGYRFEEAPLRPWLRIGQARAQGDASTSDGTVSNFYNGLPTNHTYYGYADLFGFTNLRDTYVDLLLDPHPQVRFVAGWHAFALQHEKGGIVSGSGPFTQGSFGYATLPATSRNLGRELDLTLRATSPGKRVFALLGWSRFWGGTAYERAFTRADVSFTYLEVGFKF